MKMMKRFLNFFQSRLVLRLWGVFMLLAGLIISFLWVVQIWLFEPNYVDATISDLSSRTQDAISELEELEEIDPRNNDNPLYYLSKSIRGKVFLVDEAGKVLFAYNRALITNRKEIKTDKKLFVEKNYEGVVAGTPLGISYLSEYGNPIIVIGKPTVYRERPAAVILFHNVTELQALTELNRRQLLIVSAGLVLAVSLVSFFLAQTFTKPIFCIEETVRQLAKGDFTAVPNVCRKDELGSLSDSVKLLSEELQRIDILRKEVIANVSHELRSPLALITGYGEMVRDVNGSNEELRNRNMDLIIREANRLSEMVDDIMDYSQLQAGYSQLKLDTYNLCEVVESSVDYAREAAKQYQIRVEYQSGGTEIPLEMDALKMTQVLRNLLNNAINHTENGGTIRVKILPESQEGGVTVQVINPGAPIPPEEARLIWERYKRIQHQGERREGTGIGLAIVKTILEAHGMEYGVTSTENTNCFWFRFS